MIGKGGIPSKISNSAKTPDWLKLGTPYTPEQKVLLKKWKPVIDIIVKGTSPTTQLYLTKQIILNIETPLEKTNARTGEPIGKIVIPNTEYMITLVNQPCFRYFTGPTLTKLDTLINNEQDDINDVDKQTVVEVTFKQLFSAIFEMNISGFADQYKFNSDGIAVDHGPKWTDEREGLTVEKCWADNLKYAKNLHSPNDLLKEIDKIQRFSKWKNVIKAKVRTLWKDRVGCRNSLILLNSMKDKCFIEKEIPRMEDEINNKIKMASNVPNQDKIGLFEGVLTGIAETIVQGMDLFYKKELEGDGYGGILGWKNQRGRQTYGKCTGPASPDAKKLADTELKQRGGNKTRRQRNRKSKRTRRTI